MSIVVNKLGMIKGGLCEQRFKARRKRERGVVLAINWLLYNNCIEIKGGWCRIISVPRKIYSFRWPIDNIMKLHGGDAELGWRRFISEIALPLYRKKTKFRLSKLGTWGADKVAQEFVVKSAARRMLNESTADLIDGRPPQDALYKDWLKEEKGGYA